jgi:hypothetical protein
LLTPEYVIYASSLFPSTVRLSADQGVSVCILAAVHADALLCNSIFLPKEASVHNNVFTALLFSSAAAAACINHWINRAMLCHYLQQWHLQSQYGAVCLPTRLDGILLQYSKCA